MSTGPMRFLTCDRTVSRNFTSRTKLEVLFKCFNLFTRIIITLTQLLSADLILQLSHYFVLIAYSKSFIVK